MGNDENNELIRSVSSALHQRRKALRMSQEELSELAGLHKTYVSDIEQGRRNLTLYTLFRIADALQFSMTDLFRISLADKQVVKRPKSISPNNEKLSAKIETRISPIYKRLTNGPNDNELELSACTGTGNAGVFCQDESRTSFVETSDRPLEELIAVVILNRRIRLGISQEELASRAGLHRSFLSDIERGARPNITLTTLARLAYCLNASPASLVEDAEKYQGSSLSLNSILSNSPTEEHLELPKQQTKDPKSESAQIEVEHTKKETNKSRIGRIDEKKLTRNKLPKGNLPGSLAEKYPEIAAEWHPKLNARLKAHRILPDSTREIWWQCAKNEAHSWQSQMSARIFASKSCPICKK